MANGKIVGPQRLVVERVSPVAFTLGGANDYTLEEALGGTADWFSAIDESAQQIANDFRRHESGNNYAVANTAAGEKWLRDFVVLNESVRPTQQHSWQHRHDDGSKTLVERLATDWPGLRNIYKEVFGKSLRSKDDFAGISREDYRKLLDYMLDKLGRKLTDFSGGPLEIGQWNGYRFMGEKELNEWLEKLVVTEDGDVRTGYAADEKVKVVVLQDGRYAGHSEQTIYVQPQADKTWHVLVTTPGRAIVAHERQESVAGVEAMLKSGTEGNQFHVSYIHDHKEAQASAVQFTSKIGKRPLAEEKAYTGVSDYSSRAALLRRAQELKLPGRSTMSEEELLDAITNTALKTQPLESVSPGGVAGIFLRPQEQARRGYGRNQNEDDELPQAEPENEEDASALEMLVVQSVKVRGGEDGRRGGQGNGAFELFAHSGIAAIPSRIPRGKPYGYGYGAGAPHPLVTVSYPDVFSEPDTDDDDDEK